MSEAISGKLREQRRLAIAVAVLYLLGVVFFMNTNPEKLPLVLLIVPFVYIFVVLYLSILLACRLLKIKSAIFVSVVIAVFGALLFILGSLHQLTIRDLVISLALTCLLTWYVMRIKQTK